MCQRVSLASWRQGSGRVWRWTVRAWQGAKHRRARWHVEHSERRHARSGQARREQNPLVAARARGRRAAAFLRAGLLASLVPTLGLTLAIQPLWLPPRAAACGCFSPPIPSPSAVDFAVNQQAELLIFEVEGGVVPHVTAHVLIKYAGDPEKFAWLIPVPAVPELSLSESGAFALVDQQTRPITRVNRQNVCPEQKWQCQVHPPPDCTDRSARAGGGQAGTGGQQAFGAAPSDNFGAGGSFNSAGGPPPVVVHARQSVGDYETVTIGAGDGAAAVAWLNDEGFIVNASMGKYMQPYLDAGMLFLASKLQPEAAVDELRPLKMRYVGDTPAIPLRLTAVAAEPHLTVTAFIYADGPYEPFGHPIVEVADDELGSPDGRADNYATALARLVDESGGDGFALEYYGPPPTYQDPNPQCCNGGQTTDADGQLVDFDACGVANNGSCECPRQSFDAEDCGGEGGPAAEIALVDALAAKYPRLTRLTTRLSPEDMTFDPVFRPMWGPEPVTGRRSHTALHVELGACVGQVIVPAEYEAVQQRQACAGVYCGAEGECGATEQGVGCECGGSQLARVYTELDGSQSVTCVPQLGTVDFSEGGLRLPDACAGQALEGGAECFDIGGFPAVLCPAGTAAVYSGAEVPTCWPVVARTGDSGARNYTGEVDQIAVCAPAPPTCPQHGWLTAHEVGIAGVECESSIPDPSWLVEPPKPTCEDFSPSMMSTMAERRPPPPTTGSASRGDSLETVPACGCRTLGGPPSGGRGVGGVLLGLLVSAAVLRRRRRRGPRQGR